MDLAGDGQPDLVTLDGPTPGLFEHDDEEGWQPFRPFTSRLEPRPARSEPALRRPRRRRPRRRADHRRRRVRLASVAGGRGLRPGAPCVRRHSTRRKARASCSPTARSPSTSPTLSGDGLTDLVRIRNGEVCYWPNLGYGRFGAKVTMDHAPWFDDAGPVRPAPHPPGRHRRHRHHRHHLPAPRRRAALLQPVRQRLERSRRRCACSRESTTWSRIVPRRPARQRHRLPGLVVAAAGRRAHAPMRYVNLMGGRKPHLLVKVVNNLGAETRVDYAPSTKFYLQDKRDGKPWITRLPFPVHVVERVETLRPRQPQPLRHPLRVPPRLLRRRGARVPRLRDGRAVRHRGVRGLRRRRSARRRRAGAGARAVPAARDDPHLVPHRRVRSTGRASCTSTATSTTAGTAHSPSRSCRRA